MPRDLRFSIDGDPSSGINAFKALRKEAEETGKALNAAMGSVSAMSKDLSSVVGLMRGLRDGALASSRAVRSMSQNLSGVGARAREVTAALKAQGTAVNQAASGLERQRASAQHVERAVMGAARASSSLRTGVSAAAAQTGVLRSGLMASSVLLGRMATQAALFANRLAVGVRSASIATRGGLAGTAQGLQGLGIGFRMSGLAIGNQLANMGGQGIQGLLGGLVGATAAGAEMAVRLVSSLTGTAVRLLGGAANIILAPIGALVQGVGELIGTVFTKAIGGTVSMALQAVGNFTSAFTNLIGEAVSQVGNIFTGVVEAARGAFQGAVNIASNILGSLVGVAQGIVDKVGGVLGTVGKTLLGIGGTLGGFALNDFMNTESGLTKGIVLLDDKLSAGDKKALRAWAEDLHRQMPTITREAIGDTFQRVVSTGFSGDLAGAKKATEAAMGLQFATEGGGDPAAAARVVAKAFSVYRDELEQFPDPLQRISDLLFQTVNAADVSLSDLVSHLGMVLGPAKSLGMSLEDLLVLIAKMSRTADVEQTFTGLRRLLLEPLKMSKDAVDILGAHGLSATTLAPEETSAIRAKQKAIADKETEIARMERSKRHGPEEAAAEAKQRAALIAKATADVARARTPFARKQAQIALAEMREQMAAAAAAQTGTPRADATEEIKAAKEELRGMKKELAEFEKTAGSVTNLKAFIDDLTKAKISSKELSVVFPDIRALVAAMTLSTQDPKMSDAVEDLVRNGAGKTSDAIAEQSATMKVKLLQLWEGLKSPFQATLNSMETPLKGFLDRMTSGLMDLSKWWEKAINHPGAARLFNNIGDKVGGLFSGLGLSAPGQGDFWRTLEMGLNKAWEFGTKAATAIGTLATAIMGLVKESAVLGGVWEKMKAAGSWLKDTGKQLASGSTKNLSDAWAAGKGVFDTLWAGAEKFITPLLDKAEKMYNRVLDTAKGVFSGIANVLSTAVAGVKAVLPLLAAYALAPAARAIGAAFRAPGGLAVVPGAAGSLGGGSAGLAMAAAGAARASGGGSGGAGGLLGIPYREAGGPLVGGPAGGMGMGMAGMSDGSRWNYDPLMGPPKGGFMYGMKRLGAATGRGLKGLGQRFGSPGGIMALGLGASMIGGGLSENGHEIAGGALQGAGMGSIGFALGPIVGSVTTALGALVGAISGASSAIEASSARMRAQAAERAGAAAENMGGLTPVQQAQQFRRLSLEALKAQDWNQVAAFDRGATGAVREGTLGAIGSAQSGDFGGALETVNTLRGIEKATVDQVFKDRGTTYAEAIRSWTEALKASEAVLRKTNTDKALAERAGGVFGGRQAGLAKDVSGAQEAMNDFEDGIGRASDAATTLSDFIHKLEAGAIGAFAALRDIPPGSEEAANALREAAQEALRTATYARNMRRQAENAAAEGAAMSAADMGIPALDNILGMGQKGVPWDSPNAPVAAAAPALKATAEAADDAAEALETLKVASVGAAAAASAGASGSNRLSPQAVEMTGGEARTLKAQLRRQAHRDRNAKHEKYDQFGNKIDPFTGWPTVGDQGGIGWNTRDLSGDMGSSSHLYGSSRGTGKKFTKPYTAKVANDDGSEYVPTAVGPNGSLVGAAKGAESSAKKAAGATREAANAIGGTGKAMTDVAKAATDTAKTAREGIAVTREAVTVLNSENMRQDAELAALRASISAISAGEAGA